MSQHQQPAAVLLGPLMVVTPFERMGFTPVQWSDIACAFVADHAGLSDLSAHLIGKLEARLGTNPAHREAVINGDDAVLARIRAAKVRQQDRAYDRARRLAAALAPVEPTEPIERLLWRAQRAHDKADALQAADDAAAAAGRPRVHRKAIKAHLGDYRRFSVEAEALIRAEEDRRWLNASLEETKQLAQARGEEVETEVLEVEFNVLDEWGAPMRHKRGSQKGEKVTRTERFARMTIESRGGGIEFAWEKGHLEGPGPKPAHLKAVGQRYRDAYEIILGLTTTVGGGGSGGGGERAPQPRVVAAGEYLAHCREDLTPTQRQVLDLVCGQDLRLRPVAARLGKGFPSTRRALHGGLVAAYESLARHRQARVDGQEVSAVSRVKAVTRVLRKVRR